MKNSNIYCLKVENKRSFDIEMYFRDNLFDIVRLKALMISMYPKKIYSICKVSGVPLLSCLTLDENELSLVLCL